MYLATAADTHKDQTYFLWRLTEQNLRRTIFPLGDLTKDQVRQIARDHGYETLAKKRESQEICFVPDNDYRRFLRDEGVETHPGDYIDREGHVLGYHEGFQHYTIGQRKGLGIALGSPRFVTHIDAENNRVMLGERDDLLATEATATDLMLIDEEALRANPEVEARVRYRSPAVKARVAIEDDRIRLQFEQAVWGITPGQSLVMYQDGRVVGGGILGN